ncbi:GrpB family protein [Marimonas arenosa]|uniref:GrpB family protein n=1 Tax=Marimonas arenosa TaxID=1795305 RepID=A0AAE3WGJ7_9RHOB|nr:GrpB family protein [Marimonas arenosa]MDQ2091285.1 GrpB family protein [Marimonas arenosa]
MPPRPPSDSAWPVVARDLSALPGPDCLGVHPVGSTAVPGLPAKPLIDLQPVVSMLDGLDAARPALGAAGDKWMGTFGLPNRRHLRRDARSRTACAAAKARCLAACPDDHAAHGDCKSVPIDARETRAPRESPAL